MAQRRPLGVWLVGFITMLSGSLHILAGMLVLTGTMVVPGGDTPTAWVVLIAGMFVFFTGLALLSGNRSARVIATVGLLVSLLTAVFHVLAHLEADIWPSVGSGAFALLGLGLLYTSTANTYFGSRNLLDRI